MGRVLEVVAHPTGPWLVIAGDFQYSVPPDLGRALLPLTGRNPADRDLRACLADTRSGSWVEELSCALSPDHSDQTRWKSRRRVGKPIRFRVPLVPAKVVRRIADLLKVLTGNRGLAAMMLLGGSGYLAKAAGSGQVGFTWDLGPVAAGLGLFLLTAIWHELGHAAALARSGYPPGGIGAGVLFVIPVLFADVTAVGVLSRADRLRVDVAGVIFQLAAGGYFMALASSPGLPLPAAKALTFAGSSALLAVSWSLFPFIRSDGYWLLCDLLGLIDLDRPPPDPPKIRLRIFLVVFQLSNAVFLLMVGLYFPWRMTGLLFGVVHRIGVSPDSSAAKAAAAVAGLAFLGMMGIGITRRVKILVCSAASVARGD